MVAGTQKVLFLRNCCSTTLVPSLNDQSCCSGTTGRAKKAEWRQNHCHGGSSVAVVAEWRHSGRHNDRSMDAIGRPKEVQWWCKEGRRVAQIDTQCSHFLLGDQWPTTVHPFCDYGDVCVFILPPLSDLWATDLLGDLCATVLNMLKTSRRPWRPWRCLNVLCATLERPRQPFGLSSAFNGDLATFVVDQWEDSFLFNGTLVTALYRCSIPWKLLVPRLLMPWLLTLPCLLPFLLWWRHQMETFSALLALCEGNPPVTGGFPSQRPGTRSFDIFFDLCLNKRLSKRNAGDLRRHRANYDVTLMQPQQSETYVHNSILSPRYQ